MRITKMAFIRGHSSLRSSALFILFFFLINLTKVDAKTADLTGSWYPSSAHDLRKEISSYLAKAQVDENIKGIGYISPHAGLRFSGPVAAYTYRSASLVSPRTVIIVGFSHRKIFKGVSVLLGDEFVTPLGAAPIDRQLSEDLINAHMDIRYYPEAFAGENSIEMQVPFVQVALNGARIVLLCIGSQDLDTSEMLADALYKTLKGRKDYVIIASSDMSHYLDYNSAKSKDIKTAKDVMKMDPGYLYAESRRNRHDLMCGPAAVCAVMSASKQLGADRAEILKYMNSGDTSGGKDRVVGYLSAVFYKEENMLNKAQRKELLKIARDSIDLYLKTGKRLDVNTADKTLMTEMGAFVTLRENGDLRGCIGNMVARGPLCTAVRDMAIAAATEDPRFPKVTPDEMGRISLEISALSPMKKINDHNEIELGKHGVMVRQGFRSGVYLPQVATETGWDLDQFMDSLCMHKAGIPADSWKTGKCDIYVFTAEVFGEDENE